MSTEDKAASGRISIADAVAHVRAEIEQAMREGAGKAVRFRADEITIELSVGLSTSIEGKAGIKVWVADLGGGAKRDEATTHKVMLKMKIDGSNLISDPDVPRRGTSDPDVPARRGR